MCFLLFKKSLKWPKKCEEFHKLQHLVSKLKEIFQIFDAIDLIKCKKILNADYINKQQFTLVLLILLQNKKLPKTK